MGVLRGPLLHDTPTRTTANSNRPDASSIHLGWFCCCFPLLLRARVPVDIVASNTLPSSVVGARCPSPSTQPPPRAARLVACLSLLESLLHPAIPSLPSSLVPQVVPRRRRPTPLESGRLHSVCDIFIHLTRVRWDCCLTLLLLTATHLCARVKLWSPSSRSTLQYIIFLKRA